MPSSTFKSAISITHIGTATAILSIDGINFLTDPFVSHLFPLVSPPPEPETLTLLSSHQPARNIHMALMSCGIATHPPSPSTPYRR